MPPSLPASHPLPLPHCLPASLRASVAVSLPTSLSGPAQYSILLLHHSPFLILSPKCSSSRLCASSSSPKHNSSPSLIQRQGREGGTRQAVHHLPLGPFCHTLRLRLRIRLCFRRRQRPDKSRGCGAGTSCMCSSITSASPQITRDQLDSHRRRAFRRNQTGMRCSGDTGADIQMPPPPRHVGEERERLACQQCQTPRQSLPHQTKPYHTLTTR